MLMLKNLGSALAAVAVLSLGAYSAEAAAKPHGHHVSKHQHAKKNKLHPACKQYTLSAVPLGIVTKAIRPS